MTDIAPAAPHVPVMLEPVLEYLDPQEGGVYVDGTFGAGGYTRGILNSNICNVFAIDRDPNVKHMPDDLSQAYEGRVKLLQGCFADMQQLLQDVGVDQVDGIVLDIGVSSMQLDQAERGFSFMADGPLDMRMSQSGMSAADVVNTMEESQLADVIYQLGGEKKSRRVARAIVQARSQEPISTTKQLAEIIRSVVRMKHHQIDPATRTFQALRIWVNDELGQLTRALEASVQLLAPGGRLVVVTFHSLEDKIVKDFCRTMSGATSRGSRHLPDISMDEPPALFAQLTRKAVEPSEAEVNRNPRSRSAKLRALVKKHQEDVS